MLVCADLFSVPFIGIKGGTSTVGGGTSAARGGILSSSTPSPEIGRPCLSNAPSLINASSFSSSETVIMCRSVGLPGPLLARRSSSAWPASEYLEYVSSSEGSICRDNIDFDRDNRRCEPPPPIDFTRLIVPVVFVSSTRRCTKSFQSSLAAISGCKWARIKHHQNSAYIPGTHNKRAASWSTPASINSVMSGTDIRFEGKSGSET